jgi:hypothetical protein
VDQPNARRRIFYFELLRGERWCKQAQPLVVH